MALAVPSNSPAERRELALAAYGERTQLLARELDLADSSCLVGERRLAGLLEVPLEVMPPDVRCYWERDRREVLCDGGRAGLLVA